jgi:hypothetical protein
VIGDCRDKLGFRFGWNWSREEELEARVHPEAFIRCRSMPSRTAERGEVASVEEKRSTPSCCPPCARRGWGRPPPKYFGRRGKLG